MYTLKIVVVDDVDKECANISFTENSLIGITEYADALFEVKRNKINKRIEQALDKESTMRTILKELKNYE